MTALAPLRAPSPTDTPLGARLLGRDAELAVMRSVLADVRAGTSGRLVLRGGPGMGKTALLHQLEAEGADLQLLAVAGIEAESGFRYGGVHRLLVPVMAHLHRLPAHQQEALTVAFGRASGEVPALLLVAQAVLTLLGAAAVRRPVLCLVDDAHWLDAESIHVLAVVARRLHAEGVAMVVATSAGDDADALGGGLGVLDLPPLRAEEAVALVHAAAATPVDPLVAEHVAVGSGGCPLSIVEAARSLSAHELAGGAWLPATLPLTPRLEAHFHRQVAVLPPLTRSLLLLLVAEPCHDDDSLRRAAAHLGLPLDALDAAVDAGLVSRDRPLWIRHPLIRSAVYAAARNAERRRVHQALAMAIDPRRHLDRHALHLAAASPGPDEWVACVLDRAALVAGARGGPAARARFCTRAAELTPDPVARAGRLLDAAEAALAAGLRHRAATLVRLLEPASLPPILEARRMRAASVSGQHPRRATLEEVGAVVRRGPVLPVVAVAVAAGELRRSGRVRWPLPAPTAATEIWDVESYRQALRRLERAQREHQELDALRVTLLGLSRLDTWVGRLEAADERWREARALALVIDGPGPSAELWAALGAEILAWQGRGAEARCAIDLLTGALPATVGAGAAADVGWLALTRLELGQGRYREALAAAQVLFAADVPPEATLVAPDLVEAGVRSGDVDRAQAALERLAARATVAGHDWGLGVLARSRALMAGDADAEPCYRQALHHLSRSPVRVELARAHLLYGEWLRRGRRRTDARQQLRTAHELFVQMGVHAFAERARGELAATGALARKRSVEHAAVLTPREEHVARLAGDGHTNAEIAERLYLSPRTVDYHLRKVYRKLGVASRRELRGILR